MDSLVARILATVAIAGAAAYGAYAVTKATDTNQAMSAAIAHAQAQAAAQAPK